MSDDCLDEYEVAEQRWRESHADLLESRPVVVRVLRWEVPRGWRWWNRGGLELHVHGLGVQGVTQTYRSRSFDDAREMVIDYLRCYDIDVVDLVARPAPIGSSVALTLAPRDMVNSS